VRLGSLGHIARRLVKFLFNNRKAFVTSVNNRLGLEIGGPSSVFGDDGILPIYRYVRGLDNCVYSLETIWGGCSAPGATFQFHPSKPKGTNIICEASDLHPVLDGAYDFILSSHSLEHSANPLKVLVECRRVTKAGGALILILPHYRYTFDHRRTPTSLAHMIEDYRRDTNESDLTHLNEILELHDLSRDPPAGSPEQFRDRCMRNIENRCMHHHVFDEHNGLELVRAAGYRVALADIVKSFHIVILAFLDPQAAK